MIFNNEKGFVLLAAIIASLILLAVGMLVIYMSTGDLRTSSVTVGDKKALAATESGISRLIQDFNTPAFNYGTNCSTTSPDYNYKTISSGASAGVDSHTKYAVCTPTESDQAPLCPPGDDCSLWQLKRYDSRVVGNNTFYNSLKQVNIGIGYRSPKEY